MKKYLNKRFLSHTALAIAILCSQTAIAAEPTFLFRYPIGYVPGNATPSTPQISISPISLSDLYVGETTSVTAHASGGTGAISWSKNGNLPNGLNFSSNGVLSGTPTEVGTFNVTFVAEDKKGSSANYATTLHVYNPVGQTIDNSLPINVASSINLTVTGGKPPYDFSMQSGSLPGGMSLASGKITGTPTTAGYFAFTIQVKDANNRSTTINAFILVSTSVVASAAFTDAYVGEAYFGEFKAGGGDPNYYSWLISSGTLPSGLTLNDTTGKISGTVTTPGNYTFTGRVTDGYSSSEESVTLAAYALPELGDKTYADPYVGSAYSEGSKPTVTGGKAPFTWMAANLPAGLTISSSTGVTSGTPTATTATSATITVADANARTTSKTYVFTPLAALALGTKTYADPYVGIAYEDSDGAAPTISGGKSPYAWSATNLPAGLSINSSTGHISGIPTAATPTTATITVTDTNAKTVSKTYAFSPKGALALSAKTYTDPYVGTAYTIADGTAPTITGGVSPYTWSGTNLPAGMTIDVATGLISGTPTSETAVTATITVTDANAKTTSNTYAFTPRASLALATKTFADPYVGTAYSAADGAAPTSSGGRTPYTWSATNLPAGMSIDATTGLISGTATATTAKTATISIKDANNKSISNTYTFTPRAVLALADKTYADPYVGTAYAVADGAAPTVSGGLSPYTWAGNSLPSGMSINPSTGVISGTPTTATATTATITVTDANSKIASKTYVFSPKGPLTLADKTYSDPYVGTAYTAADGAAPTASGGLSPYTWSATSLPAGLTISSSTGLISGIPTATTAVTATITVKDANNKTFSKSYTFTPRASLVLAAKTFADSYVGTAYPPADGAAPTASGGKTPYNWSATNLPAGMSITASTGVISGTPTSATAVSATITVTDANGIAASRAYAFTPQAVLALAAKTYADPYLGTAYATADGAAPTVSGGKSPYTWTATSLPAGMSIAASTGVISGTPTSTTAVTATITVTDANSKSASKTYSFSPRAALAISNALATAMDRVSAVNTTLTATGGKTAYTWSATGLPTGLSINASTGAVTGTPTANGTFSTVVTVTDANSKTASKSTSITITSGTYTATLAAGSAPVTLKSLFTTAQWSSDIPKVVNLPSGIIRGNTTAAAAVAIGGSWGGDLTFNVAGQIQGAPGAANSGTGGMAFNANYTGTAGQKINVYVTGYIRGGGGGGGQGGTGGAGAFGYFEVLTPEATKYSLTSPSYYYIINSSVRNVQVTWNNITQTQNNSSDTRVKFGDCWYKQEALVTTYPTYTVSRVSRECITSKVHLAGGIGGAGGTGGTGIGYNATQTDGIAGAAGTPGETSGIYSGGAGGTGGKGGMGGGWGVAGSTGATGANGGTGSVAPGTGLPGTAGGSAGVAIAGIANVTLSGTTANVVGLRN